MAKERKGRTRPKRNKNNQKKFLSTIRKNQQTILKIKSDLGVLRSV